MPASLLFDVPGRLLLIPRSSLESKEGGRTFRRIIPLSRGGLRDSVIAQDPDINQYNSKRGETCREVLRGVPWERACSESSGDCDELSECSFFNRAKEHSPRPDSGTGTERRRASNHR